MAPANVGHCYWVEASDGSTEYFVSQDARGNYRFDACTCSNYQQRGDPCKHAMAVRLLQACERRAARTAAEQPREPIPFPTPTLDPDQPIPVQLTPKAITALDGPNPEPCPAA